MALREVILTVLARGEMTGYEITKDFEAVYVHFWRASHQQVYRELARLNKDGRVTVKVIAQEGRPDKKVYAITKRGLEELKRWIVAPTEPPRPQYDLLVKLLGCHVVERRVFFIANWSASAPWRNNGSITFERCGGNVSATALSGPSTTKSSISRFVAGCSSGKRSCDGWTRSVNSSRTGSCLTEHWSRRSAMNVW